ncbi:MAG TPA: zinc ribbon domain-containing protein [Thermomicrobiaceae bacterium]|nr:zinc ribbon domain-containing protein [Thermomicrobiaceae bacterium]
MLCPNCSEPQLPGARRCPNCGARVSAPGTVRRRQRRSAGGVLLFWTGMGVVALLGLVLLPGLIGAGAHRVASGIEARIPRADASDSVVFAATPVSQAASGSSGAVVADATATRVVLTAQDLNARVAEHARELQPLDHVQIDITTTGIVVDFGAYNLSGTYHGKMTVVDGVPLVTGGKISGVLGWFVTPDQLESALNQEIAAAVSAQGVWVEQVETQPGTLIFYVRA